MILPIVLYPSTLLRKASEPVPDPMQNLKKLVKNMFETMYNAQGIGLAAPQVGQSLRLFVVGGKLGEDEEIKHYEEVFINPRIVCCSTTTAWYEEGCLSVPGVRAEVERPVQVQIAYEDLERVKREQTFRGLLARVVQHEYDHLEGTLFMDKISALKRRLLKKKLEQIGKTPVFYPTQIL